MIDEKWIRDYYKAADSMNMKEYLEYHTDDLKFRFGSNETTTGKEPVEQSLTHLWNALQSMSHTMTGLWIQDNVAIVEADVTYTRKDGKVVPLPAATIIRVENGKAFDVRVNMDINPLFA